MSGKETVNKEYEVQRGSSRAQSGSVQKYDFKISQLNFTFGIVIKNI